MRMAPRRCRAAYAAGVGGGGRAAKAAEWRPFPPRHERAHMETGGSLRNDPATELPRKPESGEFGARRDASAPEAWPFARPRPEGGEPHINGDGEPNAQAPRNPGPGLRRNRRDERPGQ